MNLPTTDIAISTYRPEGIERVAAMLLPPTEGVRYIVSWQAHEGAHIPAAIKEREDVIVYRFNEKGQSGNRNNALSHCTSDTIIIADDDLVLFPDGIATLRKAFADNPDTDVATFRSEHGDLSRFPGESVHLRLPYPKNYYVACFEIALRRESTGNLRFCPEFGLNSACYHGGEDEMLLLSAIRRGYCCRYFPITVCAHPHPSTGTKNRLTESNLRAMGAVIALSSGASSVLRIPLKAWRVSRDRKSGFLPALRYLSSGALAAPGILRRNHDTLW